MRAIVRWTGMAALAAVSGCYSYSVAELDQLQAGTTVRARISPAQAERVGAAIGREDRVLEGSLVERGPEGVLLSVRSVDAPVGLPAQRLYQRITIPRPEIVEVEVRRLDPWRTGAVVAAAGAALLLAASQALDDGGNSPTGERPGGGESARIPLFVIPLP